MNDQVQLAERISHTLPKAVSEIVYLQAWERLRALQTAAHALDQRTTSVAAFQFAAAAVTATLGSISELAFFAGIAAISFVVGGCVAFRGIRSDPFQIPGIAPVWWEGALAHTCFSLADARAWATGQMQHSITQIDTENCERARHLNLSLQYAMAGAALVGIAAFLRIFVPQAG